MTIRPVRLRLSRTRGFNLQAHSRAVNGLPAVNCARPGKWGNPCRVGMFRDYSASDAVRDHRLWINRDLSVRSFEGRFGKPPSIEEIIRELRGKNIACFCALSEPCHGDTYLDLANRLVCEEAPL